MPLDLETIVLKAIAREPAERYATAADFASDLRLFLEDRPIRARRAGLAERSWRWCRRNSLVASLSGLLAFLVLLVIITFAVNNDLIRRERAHSQAQNTGAEMAQELSNDRAKDTHPDQERLTVASAALERGRLYAAEHRLDDALAAYTEAVELCPEQVAIWIERAEFRAMLGLFDLAEADFVRAFEVREPDATPNWYRFAVLRLSLGDQDGYRQICTRMRDRFQGTQRQVSAAELVRTTVLTGDMDTHDSTFGQTVQGLLASSNNDRSSWYLLYIVGLAEYRIGNYQNAVDRLRESLSGQPDWPVRSISWPAIAMAHHQLGQSAEARQALAAAADAIEEWTELRYETHDSVHWVTHQGAVANWPVAWWDWLECKLYYREVKHLIDGVSPTDDARLHVLRARAFAGLRQHFTADVEYAAALKLMPDDPQIRMEAHRCAGYSALGRLQLNRAAAEFDQASQLAPENPDLWRFRAIAHLGAGEISEYEQTCREMLDRFETTEQWRVAGNVALACVLRPDVVSNGSRLIPLAERAAPWPHLGGYVLTASRYRAGQYEETIRCYQASTKSYEPRAFDWAFLAMAQHQLGRDVEARQSLAEAARWIEEANNPTESDSMVSWGGWDERVVYPSLLREAEMLIRGAK